jgi:hypothetical protein
LTVGTTEEDSAAAVVTLPLEDSFVVILKGITIGNFNQFIHPQKGLWIIQSAGAMPQMSRLTQVDKNFPVDFSKAAPEKLPVVNCERSSGWSSEGCFLQPVNTFKDEKIWTYCGLSKEEESEISRSSQLVSQTVVQTYLNARYYFSLIDSKWYITFVDLRIPCQA